MDVDMELGTIERELYIDASPEVVFDVVSKPEHVQEWWPDEAHYDVEVGASGHIVFGDPDAGGGRVQLDVVEVDPPRTFAFRWMHERGHAAVEGNSLLVVFSLTPSGEGTVLRMTETGFRAMGWEDAEVEAQLDEHASAWDGFLPQLAAYAAAR